MDVWLQTGDFEAAGFVTRIARLFAGLAETNSCGSTFNALAKISTVSSVALRRPAWLRGVVLSSTGPILPVPDELIDLVRHDYPAAVDWILAHSFATPPTGYRREGIRRQLLRIPLTVT